MEEGESVGPATKMDVHLTGTGKGIPEEILVSMEKGGDIGPMDPRASPQLRERNPTRGRRLTVTGKNHNCSKAHSTVTLQDNCSFRFHICLIMLRRFVLKYMDLEGNEVKVLALGFNLRMFTSILD